MELSHHCIQHNAAGKSGIEYADSSGPYPTVRVSQYYVITRWRRLCTAITGSGSRGRKATLFSARVAVGTAPTSELHPDNRLP
jgi:hypothetical protein